MTTNLKSPTETGNATGSVDDKVIIDEAFYVKKTRWGTWNSYDLQDVPLILALTEDSCISGTRFYLKGRQDNWEGYNASIHSGIIDGKL